MANIKEHETSRERPWKRGNVRSLSDNVFLIFEEGPPIFCSQSCFPLEVCSQREKARSPPHWHVHSETRSSSALFVTNGSPRGASISGRMPGGTVIRKAQWQLYPAERETKRKLSSSACPDSMKATASLEINMWVASQTWYDVES